MVLLAILEMEATMNSTTSSSREGLHHPDRHPVAHLAERTIAKAEAAMLGIFLIFLGFGGMVYPGYAGMHLSLAHSLMLIVTGAISFYEGIVGTVGGTSSFSLVFGFFYAMLALAGFAFGGEGEHTLVRIEHGPDSDLLRIVPGYLEFALYDHLLHLGLAALYLITALLGWLGGENE
jgi:hypothetical protein